MGIILISLWYFLGFSTTIKYNSFHKFNFNHLGKAISGSKTTGFITVIFEKRGSRNVRTNE